MIKNIRAIAIIGLLAAATSAQAKVEVWHLEGTIYQQSAAASNAPDGLRNGQAFTVDYTIDDTATSNGYFIDDAVQGIAINGVRGNATGYISERGLGLNVTPNTPLLGLNFVSFNAFNLVTPDSATSRRSVDELLSQYALSPLTNAGDIRFDFVGDNYPSVWGKVTSFTQAVPEPSSMALTLLGMSALGLAVRRKKSH